MKLYCIICILYHIIFLVKQPTYLHTELTNVNHAYTLLQGAKR